MSAREGLITPLTCDATGPLTTLRDADGSGLVFNINAVIAGKLIAAVNSHAALVEALQMALDDSEVMAPDGRPLCVSPETLQRMRAALARAGGSKPKEQGS